MPNRSKYYLIVLLTICVCLCFTSVGFGYTFSGPWKITDEGNNGDGFVNLNWSSPDGFATTGAGIREFGVYYPNTNAAGNRLTLLDDSTFNNKLTISGSGSSYTLTESGGSSLNLDSSQFEFYFTYYDGSSDNYLKQYDVATQAGGFLLTLSDQISSPNYEVEIQTHDMAPVPLPGAAWLLGAGLVGLIGIRKRSKLNA